MQLASAKKISIWIKGDFYEFLKILKSYFFAVDPCRADQSFDVDSGLTYLACCTSVNLAL